MSKSKYYYDKESLSYKKINASRKERFLSALSFILTSFFFGTITLLIIINTPAINTPTELSQSRELKNYEIQIGLLNKKLEQLEMVLDNIEERDNNIYRVLFEVNPIDEDIRKAGFGGVNRYNQLEGFENSDIEIEKLVKDKQEMLAAIPSIQPIRNDDMTRIASGFGMRTDPFDKSRKMHQGLDFSAPRNTPIYAASNGTITRADSKSSGYGKHIRINHGYGYQTIYAHLDSYNVKRGQRVKKGDVIGYVGNTGRSKGFHLHYEVLKDGKRVNPVNYFYGNLTADEFDEILKIASQENQSLD